MTAESSTRDIAQCRRPAAKPRRRRPRLDELRRVLITPNFSKHAEGSALIEVGDTRVICTASVQEKVPPFLYRTRQGVGHRGVRDAAARHHRAHRARGREAGSRAGGRWRSSA